MLSILHLHYFICSSHWPYEVGTIITFILRMKKTEAQREPKNIQLVKQQSPYQLQVSQLWVN